MTSSDEMLPLLPNIPTEKGEIVAGKYRVEQVIHDWGRSLVLEATDIEFDSCVVLRLPGRMYSWPGQKLAGFRDAARHATLLPGDRNERPTHVGDLETGEPFMTTPPLDGTDLGTELRRRGAFRADDAVDLVIQACEAMADAHSVGVLHCDLRPRKLFRSTRDGEPFVTVLMSLISVRRDPDASPRNRFDLDHRTDIYALGVTLSVLLSGTLPYSETMRTSPSGRVTFDRKDNPLRVTCPDLPSGLIAVVERASANDRNVRHESMASLALALAPFAPARSQLVLDRISKKGAATRS